MKLIPKARIELNTKLSKSEVHQILQKNTLAKVSFTQKLNNIYFEGIVNDDNFKIERVVYRKSFVPILIGKLESDADKTKVFIDFKIRNSTLAFVIGSLAFVFFIFIMSIIGIMTQKTNPFLLIIPVALFSFIFILMNTTFEGEKIRVTDYLKKILQISK